MGFDEDRDGVLTALISSIKEVTILSLRYHAYFLYMCFKTII